MVVATNVILSLYYSKNLQIYYIISLITFGPIKNF